MYLSTLPSQIYLINLKRRGDRRERMLRMLEVIGIDVTVTEAVDGKYDTVTGINDTQPSSRLVYLFI